MEKLVQEFLAQKSFAVCGSFRDETKYAYKILKTLLKKGREVYPVNPRLDEVEGLKCYKSVMDIPFKVDVVSFVTPPIVTEKIVKECLKKSIRKVWFQPGAESENAIAFCKDNGISAVHGLCVMIEWM